MRENANVLCAMASKIIPDQINWRNIAIALIVRLLPNVSDVKGIESSRNLSDSPVVDSVAGLLLTNLF